MELNPIHIDFTCLFLVGGLFLGWTMGANGASNGFSTAVGVRMISFTRAAIICALFLTLGAVFSGGGAAATLGKLGAVSNISHAFIVSVAAGLSAFIMTRIGIPVSVSQSIVGGIIGWNLFMGQKTDPTVVGDILLSWILSPLLAAAFSFALFHLAKFILGHIKIHILSLDKFTRGALIAVGALSAYSLGANNIANVMGVFIPSSPFKDITLGNFSFSGTQILFLLGAIAISVGVLTFSKKVAKTVGHGLFRLSPMAAFITILSHSLVLLLFSSQSLHNALISIGLPALPLVPVSSTQAIVGSIIGIGLAKCGGRNINYGIVGKIALGWVITPLMAGIFSFGTLKILALFN